MFEIRSLGGHKSIVTNKIEQEQIMLPLAKFKVQSRFDDVRGRVFNADGETIEGDYTFHRYHILERTG